MGDFSIRVRGLSKSYALGAPQQRADTLYELLTASLARPFRRGSRAAASGEMFRALDDVSFEVQPGEVIGVIGRNGAGKSTLLKILCRITAPTVGHVEIRGRLASLLEVGTGFHPELSGRENIFLNGAILGMRRHEVARKFDEIVAFAGVERFLDTPVKRYSSGMYVRLAFAVAAHMDPQVLVVDEVLAVGDAEFQKKCMGKMSEVASGGRTILFVSHNLSAVEHFCRRGIYLHKGRIAAEGPIDHVVAAYSKSMVEALSGGEGITLGDELLLRSVRFPREAIGPRDRVAFELSFLALKDCDIHELHVFLCEAGGDRVAMLDLRDPAVWGGTRHVGARHAITYEGDIRRLPLVEGTYRIGFTIRTSSMFRQVNDVAEVQIAADPSNPNLMPYAAEFKGSTVVDFDLRVTGDPHG